MSQAACSFEVSGARCGRLDYLLYLPRDYGAGTGVWPLVLFLHGAGERGDDLSLLKRNGIPRLVDSNDQLPFIAVSPQCAAGSSWHRYARTLICLLDDVLARLAVDASRVYLTGISMGGYGAWYLGSRYPQRFAAIAPICGGGLPSQGFPRKVERLREVPIWAFHGALDTIVPPAESESLVYALRAYGGDVRFTLYPDAGHDAWTRTYDDPAFFAWLLSQRRGREASRQGVQLAGK